MAVSGEALPHNYATTSYKTNKQVIYLEYIDCMKIFKN